MYTRELLICGTMYNMRLSRVFIVNFFLISYGKHNVILNCTYTELVFSFGFRNKFFSNNNFEYSACFKLLGI